MPHIPEFPPTFDDWKPAPPPFPPIPTFFVNPLTSEQRGALEEEFGPWAARRTMGMLSPRETYETTRSIARRMYETFMGRPPPRVREPRERKARVPSIAEELAPVVGILTPELETSLTDAALEEVLRIREQHRRMPRTEEQIKLAKAVVAWAEEEGVKITEEQGKAIVDKAIARFAPVRA